MNDKIKTKLANFYDLASDIKNHMKWDDAKSLLWWQTANPNIGGFTPMQYYHKRPEKCIAWIKSMIEMSTPNVPKSI